MAAKRRHHRRRNGGRTTPKGTRPPGSLRHEPEEPDLFDEVRGLLRTGDALPLLEFVSQLVALVDPRSRSPFVKDEDEDDEGLPDLTDLVRTFAEVQTRETTALLAVLAQLVTDPMPLARIRSALAHRDEQLPRWLEGLAEASPTEALLMTEPFGDIEQVLLGVQLADGQDLTFLVLVDLNAGIAAKDAFAVPDTPRGVQALSVRHGVDLGDVEFTPLDLADARARAAWAVEHGARFFPPFESETWPACRPLVEWALRLLPEGGAGHEPVEWSEQGQQEVLDRFLASTHAEGLDDDEAGLADSLVWFGTGYGPGDPHRWSPTSIEIVMLDWIPRKIVAEPPCLTKAPDVLRAFVLHAADISGLRPDLVEQNLAAIDDFEPEYLELVRSARPQGVAAILAATGSMSEHDAIAMSPSAALAEVDDRGLEELLVEHWLWRLGLLVEAVGGPHALETLTTEPLADEGFDWSVVPEAQHDRVVEVLAVVDACVELFDAEHRTACRRYLAQVVAGDGAALARGRAETAAGAVVWTVGRANGSFDVGEVLVGDLMDRLGIKGSLSKRAQVLMRAAGMEVDPTLGMWEVSLGDPALLVSRRRQAIIDERDDLRHRIEQA